MFILEIYYLSQCPVTTRWFELQTFCVQRNFLITSTMLCEIYSQFKPWCSHWNLWSIINLEQDISKLYTNLSVEIFMERKSYKSCEMFFSQLQNRKLRMLDVVVTQNLKVAYVECGEKLLWTNDTHITCREAC